jgi:hypothetical protein
VTIHFHVIFIHVTIRVYFAHFMYACVALGGLVVSVLGTGPKVRGFDPDRGRWIFKGDKNP